MMTDGNSGTVITTDDGLTESQIKEEFVHVPKHLKGYVIGIGGRVVKKIQQASGAKVVAKPRDEEGFTVTGNEEQRGCAKNLISQKLAGARMTYKESQFNKGCYYIDGWNVAEDSKLKLEQIAKEDGIILPESLAQYRIKAAKADDAQKSCRPNDDPTYMSKLKDHTLESLRQMKREMGAKSLKADMWCHFGKVIIRRPMEDEDAEREYTIEEATSKFQENRWKASFQVGVHLNDKILQDHLHAFEKTPAEYKEFSSRYDLTFLMPNGRQIFLRLWATEKNLGKRLEDIQVHSRDIKNVVEEIHFKDEFTRLRCRGWLLLPSIRFLRADILFPGCEFDCRLTITGHNDRSLLTDHLPSKDTTSILANYLSELTFSDQDDFGLVLPRGNMPEGFQLDHMRCCKRALYSFMPGFTIVLSKEISPRKDTTTETSRVSTAFYLLCDEWEELLSKGGWEPEAVVEKLPDFFQFVKKVQSFVVCEMKQTGLAPTIPPEIRARGPSALEAYNKALADGKTSVKRVPIMLIGQDRAGKTSLKKSLRGIGFDPKEGSTVGIDVDPSCFKVTTEMWRTGTTEKDQNADAAISFDRHAAMWVVGQLKKEGETGLLEDRMEEIKNLPDSKVTEIPRQPGPTESSKEAEHIQSSSEARVTFREDVHQVVLGPSKQNLEDSDGFAPRVPEVVAVETETLLQGGREDGRDDVYSTLWDFSGQSVYYVTHPLFLTARAIFCLVYDLSLNPDDEAPPLVRQGVYEPFREEFNLNTNMDYLDFWMRSVASLASLDQNSDISAKSEGLTIKIPAVCLVCTHADTPYDNGNPRKLAYKILGRLRKKPYGNHLLDVFVVDNTKSGTKSECQEVVRLRQRILTLAKTLPHANEDIPIKWLKFVKCLSALKERGNKYISLKSATVIASEECNIVEDKELKTLVNYLHDLRSLIHFDDSPKLSKIVVLDPQWLIDVFKKVITVQPAYECKEEKFLQLWGKLEEGFLDEKLLRHMWEPLLENSDTCDSLVEIMEKFSLLCRWPSGTSENESYLVPSMLSSHPSKEITELVESASIPSLFLKFGSGHVPPGFFPRLVLKFFQCGEFWKQAKSKLFHNFARFFTSDDENCSVILFCHSSSIEIVVHKGNRTLALAGDHSSARALSTDFQCHTVATEVSCAGAVRRRLGLMIECMRNEFSWLRDIKYELCVLCPVCCYKGAVKYCGTDRKQRCKEEQCLHFLPISELCSGKENTFCNRSATAQDTQISVMQFSHWFDPSGHQLAMGDRDKRLSSSGEGNEEKAIALPDLVRKSLSSQSCDSTEIVNQLKKSLRLSHASLESPDAETKKWIRCLAKEANIAGRSDVVKSLRNISPAGTTGPLLPEKLDVREIPIKKARQLTMGLTVAGEKWQLVAEKLGLSPLEIRFLDERITNPVEAALSYVAHQRCFTLGDLYDVLADCGLPLIADEL